MACNGAGTKFLKEMPVVFYPLPYSTLKVEVKFLTNVGMYISTKPHGITNQKAVSFMLIAVRR